MVERIKVIIRMMPVRVNAIENWIYMIEQDLGFLTNHSNSIRNGEMEECLLTINHLPSRNVLYVDFL